VQTVYMLYFLKTVSKVFRYITFDYTLLHHAFCCYHYLIIDMETNVYRGTSLVTCKHYTVKCSCALLHDASFTFLIFLYLERQTN